MSDNAVEIIEADGVEAKSKTVEKAADESKDTSAVKVNGTADEVKKEDDTSPMPGPGEIENMTVVDEVSSPQGTLQSNDVVPTDDLLVVKEEENLLVVKEEEILEANLDPTFKVPDKPLPVAKKREREKSKEPESRPPDKKLKTEAAPEKSEVSHPKPSATSIYNKEYMSSLNLKIPCICLDRCDFKPKSLVDSQGVPEKPRSHVDSRTVPDKPKSHGDSRGVPDKPESPKSHVDSRAVPDKHKSHVDSKSIPDKHKSHVDSKSIPDKHKSHADSKSIPDKSKSHVDSKSIPEKPPKSHVDSKGVSDKLKSSKSHVDSRGLSDKLKSPKSHVDSRGVSDKLKSPKSHVDSRGASGKHKSHVDSRGGSDKLKSPKSPFDSGGVPDGCAAKKQKSAKSPAFFSSFRIPKLRTKDVEMLSSDDEVNNKEGGKEKTSKDDKKDDSSQGKTAQKRKADGPSDGSKSKKSVTSEDGKTSDNDSKKEGSGKNDVDDKGDRSSRSSSKSKSEKTDSKKEKSASEKKELPKTLPLLEKYWKAVKDDPNDFTGWTYLLQYVDQANDIKAASEVYDDFLSRYPYCYGYWRKYADYLKKNGHKDKCEETFEKGIESIPLSVDLWIHYLNYKKDAYSDDESAVRKLFERSLQSCGLEFRSDRLWDAYVKWEADNGNLFRITNIFDRWLKVPTQGYVSVMDKFKEHVKKHSPNKILDPEEFFTLRNEVLSETRANNTEMECKLSDDLPPGEEAPDKLDKMNEEETKALKEKIVNSRKELHKTTQKEALARWTFEENIKRPYFHVKPLEQCQLSNWKDYLDFEIKEGNQERIVLLFERCLIACALYEEFWLKFVEYMLSQSEVPVKKVREVFVRACTIHHPKKLSIHLKWAAFEESYGNSEKAAEILEKLEKECPNVLSLILRRINVIRRRKEYEKVCSLYEHYIEENQDKREFVSSLSIKYARFCCKFLKNIEKGIEILKSAVEKDKNNSRLRLQLIDLYMNQTSVNEEEIVKVMDEVIDQENEVEKKLLFAQRKLEFLEEFSENSISCTKSAQLQETILNDLDLDVEVQNLNLIPPNNLTTASDYKFTYFYNLLPSAQALLQQATNFLQSDVFAPEQANVLFRRVNLKFLEFEKIPEGFKPDFYMKVIEVKESLILLLEDLNARYKIVQIPFSYSTILNREDSASSSKSLQPFERNNSQTTGVISSRIKQEPVDSDSGSKSPQYTHHTKKESTDFDQKSSYFDRKPPKQKPLTPIEQAKYFIKMFTACDDILTQVKNTSEKVHFHFKKFFGTPVNEYKAVFKLPDRIEEPLPLSDPNHIYYTFQLPDISKVSTKKPKSMTPFQKQKPQPVTPFKNQSPKSVAPFKNQSPKSVAPFKNQAPPAVTPFVQKRKPDMDHLIPTSVYRIPHVPTKTKCLFCNGGHWAYLCTKYPTLEMRLSYFQKSKLCKICGTHHSDKCAFTDRYCRWPDCAARGKHNSALCPNTSYPITSSSEVKYLERIRELQKKFPYPKGGKSHNNDGY